MPPASNCTGTNKRARNRSLESITDNDRQKKRPMMDAASRSLQHEQESSQHSSPGFAIATTQQPSNDPVDMPVASEPRPGTATQADVTPVVPTATNHQTNESMPASEHNVAAGPNQVPNADNDTELTLPLYVDNKLREWICALIDYVDLPSNCYPITHVPITAMWGSSKNNDSNFVGIDLEKILCVDGKLTKLRFIALAHSSWFVSLEGKPHKCVNIGMKMLWPVDLNAACNWLFQKVSPVAMPTKPSTIIYAGRLMTRRKKGDTTPQIIPPEFQYVSRLTLTHRSTRKALMDQLSASAVSQGDIVMIEAYLTWYKVDKQHGWHRWNTAYELLSVSILKHRSEENESDRDDANEGDFTF
ncbi:hypothetical protein CERSUDRAFT_74235 [Gelatoporia subvermispora B]|uniref:Uncharacterized protein n=1 Tax=Ceriporiopsis subvermispora (strain B) TaxID=914234 RepID=M2RCQ2_CERS8|nr:hypothetical protein CERSUDRAFT_74235 [Gelatoporia subvermispora B]